MDNIFKMREEILKYFMSERQESALFFAIGLVAVFTSYYLYKSGSPYQSMGYPLVAIALIQIIVGGTEFFWTGKQMQTLPDSLANDPAAFRTAEIARMVNVNFKFTVYKCIEIALLIAGIVITFYYQNNDFNFSIGTGLIIQSSFMLILDLFAERRGNIYYQHLENLLR